MLEASKQNGECRRRQTILQLPGVLFITDDPSLSTKRASKMNLPTYTYKTSDSESVGGDFSKLPPTKADSCQPLKGSFKINVDSKIRAIKGAKSLLHKL